MQAYRSKNSVYICIYTDRITASCNVHISPCDVKYIYTFLYGKDRRRMGKVL